MLADDYLPVLLFTIIGLFVPVIAFYLTRFFRFEKHENEKEETYECGELPEGDARIQFNFQYYLFALMFVVFDVIIIFLIPWGIAYTTLSTQMKLASVIGVLVFLFLVVSVVIYSLRKEGRIWI